MKGLFRHRKRIIALFSVILLFVGAYFFGVKVAAPMRALRQQQADTDLEATTEEPETDAVETEDMGQSEAKAEADDLIRPETDALPKEEDAPEIQSEEDTEDIGNTEDIGLEEEEGEEPTPPEPVKGEALASGAASRGDGAEVSFFLADVQYLDLDETIAMIKDYGVTTLTVPLVWSFLEPERGKYTMEAYADNLDKLADEGFHFIFIIDGAARKLTDDGKVVARSIPDWVYSEGGAVKMMDFLGSTSGENGPLSYSSEINKRLYLDFAGKTIEAFGARYSEHILGFAPAVMPEFEIKYPQENFAWTDYSEEALESFRQYEKDCYGSIDKLNEALGTSYLHFSELVFPVPTINNSISTAEFYDLPIYVEYQRFRESKLMDYVIPVFDLIREKGYRSFAYFGQVLHPHDGIYAAGIAVKLSDHVDVAVIDYNFYDGYGVVLDSVIPAMMTNYMKNAGYDEVWTGIYLERIDVLENEEFLQETIDYTAASGCSDGIELGGLQEVKDEDRTEVDLVFGLEKRKEPASIAIYTSEWNYYHSHGEKPAFINYFNDSLTQMYKIIQFELCLDVDILCDEAILDGSVKDYDLLIVPGQFFVSEAVKAGIEEYLDEGGKVLQDYRFGEWNEFAQNTGSWSDEYFGIGAREALRRDEELTVLDPAFEELGTVHLNTTYDIIPNAYAIAGTSDDTQYLFQSEDGRFYGIHTDNTICLCYQPQVQYKYTASEERRAEYVQVISIAIETLMQ